MPTNGLDLDRFHLQRQPTPTWAAQARTSTLPEAVDSVLRAQQDAVLAATEDTLRWVLTHPDGIARFQQRYSYADTVHGAYYTGRQHAGDTGGPDGGVMIETECVLLGVNTQGEPYAYHRFIIALRWDAATATGQPVFARDTERESVLATLTPFLEQTLTLGDVGRAGTLRVDDATAALLERRWPAVLDCLQDAAREVFETSTSSGWPDDTWFPERIEMTGGYHIETVQADGDGRAYMMLHFQGHPGWPSQVDLDYLGYDLRITLSEDGPLTYDLWGSSAI